MVIYALVAIAPLVLSVFFPRLNENEKRKRKYLILCGIVLILFMGLRSRLIGSTDTANYYNMMNRAIASNSWIEYYRSDYVEAGFQFFLFCLSRIFTSPQWIIVISSAIYVICIFYCIYKNSDNVVMSVVMYITLGLMQFEMQGMRQSIAMSLCILSFEFVKKKKFVPFILVVIFATQFHRTAFLFIAVYFISLLAYRWWNLCLLCLGSIIVFANADKIITVANEIFETDYSQSIDSGGFIATAIYVLIIVFAMLYNREVRYERQDKTQSAIMFITILGMISYIMRYIGTQASERISFYFTFGQILLLPNTVSNFKEEPKKIINVAVYVLCIGLFIYRLRGSDFLPYEFFWSTL